MDRAIRFELRVLSFYPPGLKGNEPHITATLLAGPGEHLSHCGTLTFSITEWDAFATAMKRGVGDRLVIHDPRVRGPAE